MIKAKETIETLSDSLVLVNPSSDLKTARTEVLTAISALKPALSVRTKIKNKTDADAWQFFVEDLRDEPAEWTGMSEEWKKLLLDSIDVGPLASRDIKESNSRFMTPKVLLELPTYDGTPGQCWPWWEKCKDILTKLKCPESDWIVPMEQKLLGSAKQDFWEFRQTNKNLPILEIMKKMTKIYDADRERILLKELRTIQQTGTFRQLRSDILRIFRGLADFNYKFTENQRTMWTSIAMRPGLWEKVAPHNPKTLDEIMEVVAQLRLESVPVTNALTTDVKIKQTPRSMSGQKSQTRQPICRNFIRYGRCRFGEKCKFKHIKKENQRHVLQIDDQSGSESKHILQEFLDWKSQHQESKNQDNHVLVTSVLAMDSKVNESSWYADSGCPEHVDNVKSDFSSLTPCTPKTFGLADSGANGAKTYSSDKAGIVPMTSSSGENIDIQATYVPGLTKKLFSISRIDRAGYHAIFGGGKMIIKHGPPPHDGNKIVASAVLDKNGLYRMDLKPRNL